MLKDFIAIQDCRIRKSAIKFYEPLGTDRIIVHYNIPRTEKRVFTFGDYDERDSCLSLLDNLL